jgi:hypothetical protein
MLVVGVCDGNLEEEKEKNRRKVIMPEEIEVKHIVYGVICFVVMLFFLNTIKFIGAGESAIVFNKFSGMTDKRLNEGINFINPLTDTIKKYSLKTQIANYEKIEGMSADNQTIGLTLAINWKLQPTHLKDVYQTIVGRVDSKSQTNSLVICRHTFDLLVIGNLSLKRILLYRIC